MPCPVCMPYGHPGEVPMIIARSAEELALPPEQQPPAQVIWVPCTHCCIGSIASYCDTAGENS